MKFSSSTPYAYGTNFWILELCYKLIQHLWFLYESTTPLRNLRLVSGSSLNQRSLYESGILLIGLRSYLSPIYMNVLTAINIINMIFITGFSLNPQRRQCNATTIIPLWTTHLNIIQHKIYRQYKGIIVVPL